MNKTQRRTRFETRIALERLFLTKINDKFEIPLTGMTQAAILSWSVKAGAEHSKIKIEKITKLLLEAAARGELMADNSKDVFQIDTKKRPDSILKISTLLDEYIVKLF